MVYPLMVGVQIISCCFMYIKHVVLVDQRLSQASIDSSSVSFTPSTEVMMRLVAYTEWLGSDIQGAFWSI